jgi:hypothetical protein
MIVCFVLVVSTPIKQAKVLVKHVLLEHILIVLEVVVRIAQQGSIQLQVHFMAAKIVQLECIKTKLGERDVMYVLLEPIVITKMRLVKLIVKIYLVVTM